MKYVKLYEEFITETPVQSEQELSDKTTDMILNSDFLKDDVVTQDDKGVYHISGWSVY